MLHPEFARLRWEYLVTFDISEVVAKEKGSIRLSVKVIWEHHGNRFNDPSIAKIESRARAELRSTLAHIAKTLD